MRMYTLEESLHVIPIVRDVKIRMYTKSTHLDVWSLS